jgi:spermidine synthase
MVPEVSKKYLPSLAKGFDDPRVTVHYGDGVKYLQEKTNQFDVIIVDSSDPIGASLSSEVQRRLTTVSQVLLRCSSRSPSTLR